MVTRTHRVGFILLITSINCLGLPILRFISLPIPLKWTKCDSRLSKVEFKVPLDDSWTQLSSPSLQHNETTELPIFFVKDLPLPQGVKIANIIEARYKSLIAKYDTIGLIFSDERGFASTGSLVNIIEKFERFQDTDATRVLMHAIGTFELVSFTQRPDQEKNVYAVAAVKSAYFNSSYSAGCGDTCSCVDLFNEAVDARSMLMGAPSRRLDPLQATFWGPLRDPRLDSSSRAFRLALVFPWSPDQKLLVTQLAHQDAVAGSNSLPLLVADRLHRLARGYRRTLGESKRRRGSLAAALSPEAVVERALASVVTIWPRSRNGQVTKGSGLHLGNGFIVTSAHTLGGKPSSPSGAEMVDVTLSDGFQVEAELVKRFDQGADGFGGGFGGGRFDGDVALLRLAQSLTPEQLPPAATLGDSDLLSQGQPVVALGCPGDLGVVATAGIVSSLVRPSLGERSFGQDPRQQRRAGSASKWSETALVPAPDDLLLDRQAVYVVSDAYLHEGMSGGPLLDQRGRVVGLNTFVEYELRGLGFALAINRVVDLISGMGTPMDSLLD